jgi:hypothetical protein
MVYLNGTINGAYVCIYIEQRNLLWQNPQWRGQLYLAHKKYLPWMSQNVVELYKTQFAIGLSSHAAKL